MNESGLNLLRHAGKRKAGLLFVFVTLAGASRAETVTSYTDLSTFDAAVGPTTTETFGTQNCFPLSGPIDSSSGNTCGYVLQPGVTYSATYMSSTQNYFNIDGGGSFATNFLDALNLGEGPNSLIATFDQPVSAVGFDTNNNFGDQFTITLNLLGGGSLQETGNIGSGQPFFGFQSDSPNITSISVQTNNNEFSAAFDDFTFTGSPTPEPASMFLLGSGLLGIAIAARKGRSKR